MHISKSLALSSLVFFLMLACVHQTHDPELKQEGRGPAAVSPLPRPKLYNEESPTDINNCIQATCGPANTNWNAFSVLFRPGKNLTPWNYWNQNLKPKLRELIEREKKNDIEVATRIKALADSGATIQPGQPLQAILAFSEISAGMTGQLNDVFYFDNATYTQKIYESALIRYLQNIPAERRLVTKLLIEKVFLPAAYNPQAKGDLFENSLTKRLKIKFPNRPLKEAQQKDATLTLNRAYRTRKKLGNFLAKDLIDEQMLTILQKAQSGVDLSKTASQEYMDAVTPIELYSSLFVDEQVYAALMAFPADLNQLLQTVRKTSYTSDTLKEASTRNVDEKLNTIENSCLLRIQFALNLNASALRLHQATEMAEAVKLAAKNVLKSRPFSDNNDEVLSAISTIQFALPDTNSELMNSLNSALQNGEATIQKNETSIANQNSETDQVLLQLAAIAGSRPTKPNNEAASVAFRVKKVCEALPIDTISDYTLTSLGKISVSWYSAAYPSLGVSIFAHEVGHVVSHKIRELQDRGVRADRFSDSLSCVANRNPFVATPVTLSKQTNTTWSEEDWADHFSSLVMNEMSATHNKWASPANESCALVVNDSNSYRETTLQPHDGDAHSSGILRLLFIGTDRNNLPAACRPLLAYAEANHRRLLCE